MKRFQYGVASAAACAALLLSGCGGGESGTASDAQSAEAPAAASGGEGARARGESAPAQASPRRANALEQDAQGQDAQGQSVTSGVQVTQQERQVVYVARMSVRAKEVTAAAQQAKQLVTAAGGYLSKEESHSGDGGNGSATLEFKIPPARYAEVLASLGKDLGKQLSLTQGTEDVTLQVADVNSRLKSAEQALESLRTLLKKADTIGEVLQVEREISARESDLESLQAQQKELAAQVGMATLTLTLLGPVAVVETPSEEPAGFLGGLQAGWNSLLAFVKVALTVLGAVLPWMLVVAPLVALLVWLVRRGQARETARRPPPAGPPQPQPESQAR